MNPNNGGPAFPTLHIPDNSPPAWNGMTLRDYFAINSLSNCPHNRYEYDLCAEWAYKMADAMLAEREQGELK